MDVTYNLVEMALGLVQGQQQQARLLKPGEAMPLRKYLEEKAGGRKGGNMYCVVAPKGKDIGRHDHPEDVILFYPQPEGTPVIIEDARGEEQEILPECGDVLFIPKRTFHRVPPHQGERPRVSIALKLED